MAKDLFKNGERKITDHEGRDIVLTERTWRHIIRDNNRAYFRHQFNKVAGTLEKPDIIFGSRKEKNVVIYRRYFAEFCLANIFFVKTYVYVVVNWETARVLTVYINPKARIKGPIKWQKDSSK